MGYNLESTKSTDLKPDPVVKQDQLHPGPKELLGTIPNLPNGSEQIAFSKINEALPKVEFTHPNTGDSEELKLPPKPLEELALTTENEKQVRKVVAEAINHLKAHMGEKDCGNVSIALDDILNNMGGNRPKLEENAMKNEIVREFNKASAKISIPECDVQGVLHGQQAFGQHYVAHIYKDLDFYGIRVEEVKVYPQGGDIHKY